MAQREMGERQRQRGGREPGEQDFHRVEGQIAARVAEEGEDERLQEPGAEGVPDDRPATALQPRDAREVEREGDQRQQHVMGIDALLVK